MKGTQTFASKIPWFWYDRCFGQKCLLFTGGASQARGNFFVAWFSKVFMWCDVLKCDLCIHNIFVPSQGTAITHLPLLRVPLWALPGEVPRLVTPGVHGCITVPRHHGTCYMNLCIMYHAGSMVSWSHIVQWNGNMGPATVPCHGIVIRKLFYGLLSWKKFVPTCNRLRWSCWGQSRGTPWRSGPSSHIGSTRTFWNLRAYPTVCRTKHQQVCFHSLLLAPLPRYIFFSYHSRHFDFRP